MMRMDRGPLRLHFSKVSLRKRRIHLTLLSTLIVSVVVKFGWSIKTLMTWSGSQPSIDINAPGPSLGRSSFDALQKNLPYPSQGTAKSTKESRRRPSLDMLRPESSKPLPESFVEPDLATTPGLDGNFNSVRSILRDPHT